jgi:hypothetical protein
MKHSAASTRTGADNVCRTRRGPFGYRAPVQFGSTLVNFTPTASASTRLQKRAWGRGTGYPSQGRELHSAPLTGLLGVFSAPQSAAFGTLHSFFMLQSPSMPTDTAPVDDAWGDHRVVKIRRGDILFRRDALADTPRIADLFVAVMSLLLTFARDRGYREDHPGQRIPKINQAAPYEPWTAEELAEFLKRTTPECRLATMALLFTGQRQSDIVNTPAPDKDGRIQLVQEKTGKHVMLRLHEKLKAEHSTQKVQSTRWLIVNTKGQQWTAEGLRTLLYRERERLGYLHRQPHGWRKNSILYLFEAGASAPQAASVTGQSLQMVEHYWHRSNQGTLADQAIGLWEENIP